mmetsp:Transcript_9387/g.23364  ORF Transcript_9387/g.23364 Transcript_9387/m.23364 type:complete len:203 (+) Transcript_9387:4275-4883(+)
MRLPEMQIHLVAVEVSVVGRRHSEVESQRREGHDFDAVPHHGHLVQGWLPIEDDVIAIHHVPLNLPAVLQLDLREVRHISQVQAVTVVAGDESSAWPSHRAVPDVALQQIDVVRRDSLRERQIERNRSWHAHLLRVQVRITTNDAARAVVHTLTHERTAQPSLLGLQPLSDGLEWPLGLGRRLRDANNAIVIQCVDVVLEQF